MFLLPFMSHEDSEPIWSKCTPYLVIVRCVAVCRHDYHFGRLAAASESTGNDTDRSFHYHSGSIQTVLSSDCLCSTPEHSPYDTLIHSFQLRAYELGTRARVNQTDDDLRALRRERDDALTDPNARKDQTRVWVVGWTSGTRSQRRMWWYVSPFVLCLSLHPLQADGVLIMVRHTSAA